MLKYIFSGLFDTAAQTAISAVDFTLCMLVSLAVGFLLAMVYRKKSRSSQSFITTLALLPSVVCVVILLVNGNVGAGVAVAGTFSLVRFRSAPGTAKEIGAIFIAMAAGLATGMGYLGFAVLFTLVLCAAQWLYGTNVMTRLCAGDMERMLRITIPENLDYTEIFDDVFPVYFKKCELMEVKTTNMGSLFRLCYTVDLKAEASEKELLDTIRCRNGNLEVSLSRQTISQYEL